jgi:DNA-binding MarR family transcriptional regulator
MSAGHRIAMSLRAAYLAMHRVVDARLSRLGVTADQFVVLNLLAQRDGITQQELVRRASSDPNTIRSMLVLLERRGLVARERHPTDGRARHVTLRAAGRETHQRVWSALGPLQESLAALFTPVEASALVNFLERVSGNLAAAETRMVASETPSVSAVRVDQEE